MKRLLIAMLTLTAAAAASAQSSENISSWSLRLGYDMCIPGEYSINGHNTNMFSNGSGFTFGFGYTCPIYAGIYFETGLSMGYQSYKADITVAATDDLPSIENPKIKKWNGLLPLYFGYAIDFGNTGYGVRLFTGPELSYSFSGHIDIPEQYLGDGLDSDLFGDDAIFPMQKFNAGWTLGVGFIKDHYYIQIAGTFGMTNVLRRIDNKVSFHENHTNIAIGYYF